MAAACWLPDRAFGRMESFKGRLWDKMHLGECRRVESILKRPRQVLVTLVGQPEYNIAFSIFEKR
jgi:hypothetical protein